jgi:sterol desaturase/sphingolipid hydroxylase (fatty acid hydroxylase superfamily)
MLSLKDHNQYMAQVNATLATAPQADDTAPQPDDAPVTRSGESAAAARFVRAEHIETGYSPWRHMTLTLGIAAVITGIGLALARRARPIDWVLMPAFFLVANFIEWVVHKNPMHRPLTPRILYQNHAQLHHIAFTEANLPITCAPELGLIMMPWYTMLGLFVVASPVMLVAGLMRGPGLAGVFLLGAVVYFLAYEALHALYHLPEATLHRAGIGRLRAFRRLQSHHRRHHVLRRMAFVNFNVTFPLMDRLFGTMEREPNDPKRA